MMWIAFAVIILLLGILMLLITKNKQPVYLKPKNLNNGTGTSNGASSNDQTLSQNTITAQTDEVDATSNTETLDLAATNANEDGDVKRSEVKALRQSAVAMSVSHKDGANEILKDWLESSDEEGGNSDGNSDNNVEEKK